MRLILSIFLLLVMSVETPLQAQEIISDGDKGTIAINHVDSLDIEFKGLLTIRAKDPMGFLIPLIRSPAGTGLQVRAVGLGHGIRAYAQQGDAIQALSNDSYGVSGASFGGHGARFIGDERNGFADIVLGGWSNSRDDGVIMSDPEYAGSDIFLVSNDAVVAKIDKNENGQGNFFVFDGSNDQLFQVRANGSAVLKGSLSQGSDRNRKEGIEAVSDMDILDAVIALPIYEWQYKGEERRHVGPMAQDFHHAFGLGSDDTTIDMIDVDGVALSAIKAQQEMIAKQADQLSLQRQMIEVLKAEIRSIREAIE